MVYRLERGGNADMKYTLWGVWAGRVYFSPQLQLLSGNIRVVECT